MLRLPPVMPILITPPVRKETKRCPFPFRSHLISPPMSPSPNPPLAIYILPFVSSKNLYNNNKEKKKLHIEMILGERKLSYPPVQAPPWSFLEDPTAAMHHHHRHRHHCSPLPVSGVSGVGDISPYLLGKATLSALQRFLPSNPPVDHSLISSVEDDEEEDALYSSDEFRMYEFKVRRCHRGRAHDWTACPYAHPGEKARRRDPRRFHYSGDPCPEYRKGGGFCRRGDACDLAHGVFETWLHPSRYRTQPCKDGTACPRRVCFFAHTSEQLRPVPLGSPRSLDFMDTKIMMSISPTSTLLSQPESPQSDQSPPLSPVSMETLMAGMRRIQLSKARSALPYGALRAGALSLDFVSVPETARRMSPPPPTAMRRCEEELVDTLPDLEWVSDLVN